MRNAVVMFWGRSASVSHEGDWRSLICSHEIVKERHHEISSHLGWHQKRQHSCHFSGKLGHPTGCATSLCAASAAESECIGRYQGCWKALCTPNLSLPPGLNS